MENIDHSHEVLTQLRDIGVRIALDDFGTGYSSLSHLRVLPIDTLKIDRRFVEEVVDDHNSGRLAAAIIGLAESVDASTVAEGIETADQLDALRELGCVLGQGFHIARPEPADRVGLRVSAEPRAPQAAATQPADAQACGLATAPRRG